METNPWWPRRGPAHTIPAKPSENTSWRERFDEAIRPFARDCELYLVPNISKEHKFWAIERKTEDVKDFFSTELTSLISQLEGRKKPSDFLDTITHADEELKKVQAIAMAIGYNAGITASQDLIKTYL